MARITGFVTRAQAGLVAPRSISRNIQPQRGGVASHWGGPAQRVRSHSDCLARWRSWQRMHMAPGGLGTKNGAADIAYTGAVCDHGYALAGRGAGIRTGAQGTNEGNLTFYGIVWIGGQGETPTRAAFDAFDWWVAELRRVGNAGSALRPHSFFKATSCPGPDWRTHIAGQTPGGGTSRILRLTSPFMRGDDVRELQGLLADAGYPPGSIDGVYGPNTASAAARFANEKMGANVTPQTMRVGPKTIAALKKEVVETIPVVPPVPPVSGGTAAEPRNPKILIRIRNTPAIFETVGGVLRWIKTPQEAEALHGANWREKVSPQESYTLFRFADQTLVWVVVRSGSTGRGWMFAVSSRETAEALAGPGWRKQVNRVPVLPT